MQAIDVTISRIMFHKQGRFGPPGGMPYLIARTISGQTIKGGMRTPVVGAQYRLWGDMRPQKNGYPDAFEFTSYEPLCDRTTGGIAAYLSKHLPGVGPVKAKALVDKFGVDTLDVLRGDPYKALDIPGITDELCEAIKLHFADSNTLDPVAMAKLAELFDGYRVPRKVVERCVKQWRSAAPEVITERPYLLMNFPRVGWKTADAFATGRVGFPEDGLDRHAAALMESLNRLADDGHSCGTKSELLATAERLLGSTLHDEALDRAIADGNVVVATDGAGVVYQLATLADAEATVADCLERIQALGPPPINHFIDPLSNMVSKLGVDQVNAGVMAGKYPVSIITGAPGVGKSYLIARLILRLRELGHRSIRCMAPTGKAAKRTLELLSSVGITDVPSTTIHKALEPGPPEAEEGVSGDDAKFGRARDGWCFRRHAANPIDERIIIVDESSMLDAKLAASLLSAIAPGTRLIFVGDTNQLPSVGAGAVLRDMIAAGIPTAVLTEIRRSDSAGTVVHACHDIIADRTPKHADRVDLPVHNWIHIELDDPDAIAARIVDIVSSLKTFDRMWGVQVISPQKGKLRFGCDNLNILLSKALNPDAHDPTLLTDAETGEIIETSNGDPKVGDKVVRTKNEVVDEIIELPADSTKRPDFTWRGVRWEARECPVVNGDMGTVVDILADCVLVEFRDPIRLCRLPIDESHLILAYTMTVHKMQGSGAPCVILPVHDSFYFDTRANKGIWCRELCYTAISRTEQLLITVGRWGAFLTACGRKTTNRRRTTLAARMKGLTVESLSPDDLGTVDVEPQNDPTQECGWTF